MCSCVFFLVLGACGGNADSNRAINDPIKREKSPAILMVQSVFERDAAGKIAPGPAVLSLFRKDGNQFTEERILDPESNVFHKAMPFEGGILTVGGEQAIVKKWTHDGAKWNGKTLWQRKWDGKFNRMRDVALGDLTGDGQDEMVIATHDMGVVGVGVKKEGTWAFTEYGLVADTFVHEVEIGDLEGDGKMEFYVTPSERNRANLTAQPGGVVRYDFQDGSFVSSKVAQWFDTHAKEITVSKVGGEKSRLFAVKEASKTQPVQVVELTKGPDGWQESVLVSLSGEKQARFLVVGDCDHDGAEEMVIAGMNTGLWLLDKDENEKWTVKIIDGTSGGFEQATHLADLDGDGKIEIYVASEKKGQPRQLRQYRWDGEHFQRNIIATLEGMGLVWNLQDGVF